MIVGNWNRDEGDWQNADKDYFSAYRTSGVPVSVTVSDNPDPYRERARKLFAGLEVGLVLSAICVDVAAIAFDQIELALATAPLIAGAFLADAIKTKNKRQLSLSEQPWYQEQENIYHEMQAAQHVDEMKQEYDPENLSAFFRNTGSPLATQIGKRLAFPTPDEGEQGITVDLDDLTWLKTPGIQITAAPDSRGYVLIKIKQGMRPESPQAFIKLTRSQAADLRDQLDYATLIA